MIDALAALLASAWRSTSATEMTAAILAAAYVVLAIRQRIECWAAAFVSSCLYVDVLFDARLYMESALNAFYAVMAIYGFWHWRRGGAGGTLQVVRGGVRLHLCGIAGVALLSLATSYLLRRYTPAAWPLADSLETWASVFATFLVTRKVYENWHWFLVIDASSMVLYCARGLYVTMVLFALYVALIVVGMREWRRELPGAARVGARAHVA